MSDIATAPASRSSRQPCADAVTASVHALCRELEHAPSLAPSPTVDALFARLVRLVLAVPEEAAVEVMRAPSIQLISARLRELCARGEAELEFAWAARIATADAPRDELELFPYLANYRQLCRMELGVLSSAVGPSIGSAVFVGAGPLPLSALLLAGELGTAVDIVDRDPAAVSAASAVSAALGFTEPTCHRAEAGEVSLAGYDVVVLAALVGETPQEKRRILHRLARTMSPGAVLLARSARGLRTLLYPQIGPDSLDGFDLLSVVHPVNDVINSVVLARAPGHGA